MAGSMRLALILTAVLCLAWTIVGAQVLINELCYDPDGSDTGKEWIELYNSGNTDVNLEGALLLCGGSGFLQVYEFPHFILRANRFLLIGETNVAEAALTATLGFQNGGSETDGVRFVSPDGLYTDTVLYDSPNTNGLFDDSGTVGSSFTEDAPEGYSLARRMDGVDSNDSEADWLAEENPTPGLPNRTDLDYALLHPLIWDEDGDWKLGLWVKNISELATSETGQLSISLDGTQVASDLVASLAPGDSIYYFYFLPVEDELNHQVQAGLVLPGDIDTSNNSVTLSLFEEVADSPIISEIMYDPGSGRQEWIELWLPAGVTGTSYSIYDAANTVINFIQPMSGGYYVICTSRLQLLADYPTCSSSFVIEVESWAQLNNSGDNIRLYKEGNIFLDEMSYTGDTTQQGISLERHINPSQQVVWRYCIDTAGATPGRENSQTPPIPDFDGSLKLEGSPCKARDDENIFLYYKLTPAQSTLNCSVFDRAGHRVRVLASSQIIPAEGAIIWDGKDTNGRYVPRGLYFISWESRSTSGGKTLSRQFSAVIYD